MVTSGHRKLCVICFHSHLSTCWRTTQVEPGYKAHKLHSHSETWELAGMLWQWVSKTIYKCTEHMQLLHVYGTDTWEIGVYSFSKCDLCSCTNWAILGFGTFAIFGCNRTGLFEANETCCERWSWCSSSCGKYSSHEMRDVAVILGYLQSFRCPLSCPLTVLMSVTWHCIFRSCIFSVWMIVMVDSSQ